MNRAALVVLCAPLLTGCADSLIRQIAVESDENAVLCVEVQTSALVSLLNGQVTVRMVELPAHMQLTTEELMQMTNACFAGEESRAMLQVLQDLRR